MSERLLAGWGRTSPTRADVTFASSVAEVRSLVCSVGSRGVVPRGLARSYGDAAQNAGGSVVDVTGLDRIHSLSADGVVDVDAGVSLDRLLRVVVPAGWFVRVTPGTRYVTMGGAVGSDIHGKSHHVEGSFGQGVLSMDVVDGTGELVTLTPDDDRFWATAGGMGLTGVVTRLRLQLLPIETSRISAVNQRVADLDALMATMVASDADFHYGVAWIDTLATGASMGRGVLSRGDNARREELSAQQAREPLAYLPAPKLTAPPWVPGGLLNRASIAAFNEVWFRKPIHTGIESIPAFFHPLDGVVGWNRIYGRRGFVQWQMVVPDAAGEVVRESLERLSAARCPSFLAVLKRFGPGNRGPLSFPIAGWTLALDVPASLEVLPRLLDGLDELVAEAGGRVYLTKDSRLRPDLLSAMYPRLDEWRAVRSQMDPSGVFTSDLARRLSLT